MQEPEADQPPKRAPLLDRPADRGRRYKILSGRDLRASTIGWEVAVPLFAGPLIGFLIDQRFDTGIRWTLILVIVGLITAVVALARFVGYELHMMKREMEAKEREAKEKEQQEIYDAYKRKH